MNEPDEQVDGLAREVVDAALEVHRELGPGYLESVYEEALGVELELRGVAFERQVPVVVDYKGQSVGEGRLDLLVGGELIIELKAVEALLPVHKAQVLSYLKATKKQLGLLVNFNVPLIKNGIKRIIHS